MSFAQYLVKAKRAMVELMVFKTRRLSRALYKRTINVIVDESTERDDKRKYVEGDPLDQLAKTVVDSGGIFFELHNTKSPTNSIVCDHS